MTALLASGAHPVFILFMTISIVMGLVMIESRIPMLMPFLFAGSLVGLGLRWSMIAQERRRRKDSRLDIDYEELRRRDFMPVVPALKHHVRGHDAVIDRIADRLQQNLLAANANRTLGAFLLVGPTGTGKSYLAELVAKALHPASEPIILRMNQYKSPQDVYTLIGPPPGQPGYEIGGALTRPVINDPHRVVILDEFEKCHPDIKHCFYDILDRGQCSEKSSGRTAHFGACAFVATSNAGVEALRGIYKETSDALSRGARARDAMAREGFEKALLARFDEILLMDQLKPVDVAEVSCLQLAKHWRQYGIEVSYAAPELLVEALHRNREFSEYGVRQLARLIQDLTTSSIEAARRAGATSVRLDFDKAAGKVVVTPV